MPISTLDSRTALIVVDLQLGTVAQPLAHDAAGVVSAATALVDAFRAQGLPVVLATVDATPPGRTQYGEGVREFPAEWSALVPELEVGADDIPVRRGTWSAFAGTDLDARLRDQGVTQVLLAGLATSFGVESTARAAYDLGYSVAIASDAVSDRSAEAHDNSIARVFPALGQTGTSAEAIALLAAR